MGKPSSDLSFYLSFEDTTYGVCFRENITFACLVEYAKKKFLFDDSTDVMFSYKVGSRCVNIVDDDDVNFFSKKVFNSQGTEFMLNIHRFDKCKESKASTSNIRDFDLNVPLFSNDTKNVKSETYDELWKKNSLDYIPTPPNPQPVYNTKENNIVHSSHVLKKGDKFDTKEALMYEIGYKSLLDGYEFRTRKTDKKRYDVVCKNDDCEWKIISSKCDGSNKWVIGTIIDNHSCSKTQIGMHHRNATSKVLGRLIAPKFKDHSRVYTAKDIKQDIYMDLNINITYKQAWRAKIVAQTCIDGCPIASFAQLPVYCHNFEMVNDGNVSHIETDNEDRFKMVFLAFGVVIRSFKNHMRPLIIIDAAHLKGTYKGTNLLAVGMDGNNQIIPIATGVSQCENVASWTWFMTKLKECIGHVPNLTIISDRHVAIKSACVSVFPDAFHAYCCRHLMMNCRLKNINLKCLFWKMCKAYSPEEVHICMNEMGTKRPDVYQRLIDADVARWSRAFCPTDRFNYMTSNSAESINNLTRDVRKIPITNLMIWYSELVRKWYFERREKYKDSSRHVLSDWATKKITKRWNKSVNWIVSGIDMNRVYAVDDHRRIHTVEINPRTCTCRKWQLSGLPCGHVLAACRTLGVTDSTGLTQKWFRKTELEGTYRELVYPVSEVSGWQCPNDLKIVKPPLMDNKQAGRPKGTGRILSQGEDPLPTRCGRCGARGHNRNSCREPIQETRGRDNREYWTNPQEGRYQQVEQRQYYQHQQYQNWTSQQQEQVYQHEQYQYYFQQHEGHYNSQSHSFSFEPVNLNNP